MSFSGDRLRARRKHLKLSQGELGDIVGLSQGAISDLERGIALETSKLLELARACGVSPDWLLGREADETRGTSMSSPVAAGTAARVLADEKPDLAHFRGTFLKEVEVRGGASAGGGISDEAWQHGDYASDKYVAQWGLPNEFLQRELGLEDADANVLRVRGDSMDDGSAKGLASGDRVIIDHRDTDIRQGGIFAVFDGDGVIIKQVELLRGQEPPRIVCKSRNPAYDPIPLTLESPVRIIGRVAGRISRM